MTAISAFRFWLAGGDGEGVGEDGHPTSHRPNRRAPSLAFGGRYEGGTVMVAARLMLAELRSGRSNPARPGRVLWLGQRLGTPTGHSTHLSNSQIIEVVAFFAVSPSCPLALVGNMLHRDAEPHLEELAVEMLSGPRPSRAERQSALGGTRQLDQVLDRTHRQRRVDQ